MKYLLIILAFCSTQVLGQAAENKVDSDIEEVTVFLSGAQINRSAKVRLKKGNNTIRLVGLSQYILPKSVQIIGQKGFTIVSVSQEINYMKNAEEPSHVKVKRKELESLNAQFKTNLDKAMVLQAEKEMILANMNIGGSETGVDPDELLDVADFYRSRLNTIDIALLNIEKDKKELSKKIKNHQKQLREMGYKINRPTGEILVKISADTGKDFDIDFSYMVTQAGWSPFYDIRSQDITGPVQLTYKGNVAQSTGQDWNKVKLTLSTGNPAISGTKPEFATWYLNAYDADAYKVRSGGGKGRKTSAAPAAYGGYFEDKKESSKSTADFTSVEESGVSTEFRISLPYTIPSDGKKLAVEVQQHNLPVEYKYYCAPKFDQDAFLMSRISGWDDLYLLSGSSNIYYQGTYVGSSYIDTKTSEDTLQVSLGRDNNIVVRRKKLKELCSNSTIGSNTKHQKAIEISVKNTRKTAVEIKIEDQVPVSADKEIDVEISDKGGAKLDEDTGILTWNLKLAPGESKSVVFKYTVKHDKDFYIPNL